MHKQLGLAPEAVIIVRPSMSMGQPCFIADGPDGHYSLLARGTAEQAQADGLEYFLRTRKFLPEVGRWVIQ